ncbi:MAG: DUF126 domain-containing protein [Pseudomonadota bacterium]
MSVRLDAQSLVPGRCEAPVLVLTEPLSFWGGVDPASGRVIDRQHPQHGACIAAKVLVLPGIRGSTAAPGALLELLARGSGPAALLTARFEVVPLVTVLTSELLAVAPKPVAVLNEALQLLPFGTGDRIRVEGEAWWLDPA